ncbi:MULTISPECIES: AbrB family transcriptional regulator [Pontibacillus]|uniref:AbrB family transcriptional regulator n=1 Tax=Pontibacillus chungwhensis TaxID=265426 RepID=A0ABY8UTR1_9BACI|nr:MULTISPECIES: AbrB family transcriptional regulator [Pontibacillus]MCD5323433.1 AbrB family transcriptional regulator [Pontibacillus sp. HN14]WIF96813.1 AbrB family transcriptional regulator [Pontibacillus chungwhensis]
MTLLKTYIIASIGSLLFYFFQLPLPWVLGAVFALLLYKVTVAASLDSSPILKQVSFALLGIQLGSAFTKGTFTEIGPYLFPYLLFSILLISISLLNGYLVSKWSNVQKDTSMLATIPGGLSASIALSDALESNTVLVTIFHTIRLMAVLFIIPFIATHFLSGGDSSGSFSLPDASEGAWYTLIIYIACFFLARKLNNKIPAALVIVPMILVGTLQSIGMPMYILPSFLFVLAQVTLGVDLGHKVSVKDIRKAGKYCLIYFGLSLWLILLSFGFGYLFSKWMGVSFATGVLSVAPGGLLEMALTAQSVGGDPAIVSSLQLVRLLIVVMIVPIGLKWFLEKRSYS